MRADDGRAIPAFIGQALSGRPVTVAGDGSQTRSICYVDDTVRGILAHGVLHRDRPDQHRQPGRAVDAASWPAGSSS